MLELYITEEHQYGFWWHILNTKYSLFEIRLLEGGLKKQDEVEETKKSKKDAKKGKNDVLVLRTSDEADKGRLEALFCTFWFLVGNNDILPLAYYPLIYSHAQAINY